MTSARYSLSTDRAIWIRQSGKIVRGGHDDEETRHGAGMMTHSGHDQWLFEHGATGIESRYARMFLWRLVARHVLERAINGKDVVEMTSIETRGRTYSRNFAEPDESHEIPRAVFGTIRMEGMTISHSVMQPGWSWEDHVKPIVGGDSCQFRHFGYIISGRLKVRMNDGTEAEYGPGDLYLIDPGHTGWILGDEPAVSIEFTDDAAEFGKAPA